MVSDLERQNAQAKELLNTLEKIKAAWDELPSEDEMEDVAKASGNVAACLKDAREHWDNLPSEDDLNDLAKAAGKVGTSLWDTE